MDRIVMHLCGTTNIRDVIAFPKTQNGADLMLDAPSQVEADEAAAGIAFEDCACRRRSQKKPTA